MSRVLKFIFLLTLLFPSVQAAADIPLIINHQGRVFVGANPEMRVPFDGQGLFKFGLYSLDGDPAAFSWLWFNDGNVPVDAANESAKTQRSNCAGRQ